MSSQQRIESSRRNGAMSRGPVTPEGKRTVSQNAVRHELCAKSVTLANESDPEMLSLLADLIEVYAPEDEVERLMVTQITIYTWRLFRAFGMEADLVNNELAGQDASPEFRKAKASLRTALAFDRAWANTKVFANLNLYETRLRREITSLENRLETRRSRSENRNGKRTNKPSFEIGHSPNPAPNPPEPPPPANPLPVSGPPPVVEPPTVSEPTRATELSLDNRPNQVIEPVPQPASVIEMPPANLPHPTAGLAEMRGHRKRSARLNPASTPSPPASGHQRHRRPVLKSTRLPSSEKEPFFPQTALQTPRNAQCPCQSGRKFKRCCGLGAPPVLDRAA